jgi:uncharacterized membrane protein YfcA
MVRSMKRSMISFLFGAPIGAIGGLIGVGGAEYRLPVLAGPLRFSARQAVPLNLTISVVTVAMSLLVRGRTLPFQPVLAVLPLLVALAVGASAAAYAGAAYVRRLPEHRLRQIILVLLLAMALLMISQAMAAEAPLGLLSPDSPAAWGVGTALGLLIGLVSITLGVAGGELIIPTLIVIYGVDVRAAGTASLLVSLPTMLVGIARFGRQGALDDRLALRQVALPMAVGSVLGAAVGAGLVGFVPVRWLKAGLGLILAVSAILIFAHDRPRATSPNPSSPSPGRSDKL